MRLRMIGLSIITLLIASSAGASNGEIGLFFDSQGGLCRKSVDCNDSVTLYVYAVLEGSSSNGIGGAEYALQIGADNQGDPGWVFEEAVASNANVVLGSAVYPADVGGPHGDNQYRGRGINIAFPTCQTADGNGMVFLQTIRIFNGGCSTSELPLLVIGHDQESSQFFRCPTFNLCDDPVFTKVCLGTDLTVCQNHRPPYRMNATCSTSGSTVVNPADGDVNSPCPTTAVAEVDWGGVKSLYR